MVLEVKGITKRFPGVVANDNINFNIKAGEITGSYEMNLILATPAPFRIVVSIFLQNRAHWK